VQAFVEERRALSDRGRQHVAATEVPDRPMHGSGGGAHGRRRQPAALRDHRHAPQRLMSGEERQAAVIRDGGMIRAEEKLALAGCGQRLGYVQVDAIAAPARLPVEVCEAESGNVIKDAHLAMDRKGNSLPDRGATTIDLSRSRRICSQASNANTGNQSH
jgi:hypothetical protein